VSAQTLLQLIVNGIMVGGVYGLMSLGINLVWGVMGVVNLAHGDLIMVGGFLTFGLFTHHHVNPLLALPAAVAMGLAIGGLTQRFLLGAVPQDRGAVKTSLLMTFGVSYMLINAAQWLWGNEFQTVMYLPGSWRVAGLDFAKSRTIAFATAAAISGLLWAFLRFTFLGRAIRAISQSQDGASVCGIDIPRTRVVSFGLGAALAAAAGALLFGIEQYVLAASNRQASELEHRIRYGSPRAAVLLGRQWTAGREGDIYHYQFFDPRRGELRGFWRYQFDSREWRLAGLLYAATARVEPGAPDPARGTVHWMCRDGWMRRLRPDGGADYSAFTAAAIDMEPADYFGNEPPDAASMTVAELRQYIDSMQASGLNVRRQEVDLHRKLAFPLVTVVMTLLAVPFAVMTGRRGALYAVGVGIVLAIAYWMAASAFGAFGAAGLIPPALAAWAPNLLFGAGAAWLLLTVRT
jgi:branched-chain amino acid transport system permease protein